MKKPAIYCIDGILYDCCVLSYTQNGATILHCAAQGSSTFLIEHCINAGINVNVIDNLVSSLYIRIVMRLLSELCVQLCTTVHRLIINFNC